LSRSNRSPSIAALGRGWRFYLFPLIAATPQQLRFPSVSGNPSRNTIRHRTRHALIGGEQPRNFGETGNAPSMSPSPRSDIGKISSSTLGPVKPWGARCGASSGFPLLAVAACPLVFVGTIAHRPSLFRSTWPALSMRSTPFRFGRKILDGFRDLGCRHCLAGKRQFTQDQLRYRPSTAPPPRFLRAGCPLTVAEALPRPLA
jgi:hypothetical protein